MPIGSLYVFLHGLTVLHEAGNDVELVLPNVVGHSYLAGSWLQERPINLGSNLQLSGVQTGAASFAATQHMIRTAGCWLTQRRRAVTILLKKPKQILELLLFAPTLNQPAPAPTVTVPPLLSTMLVLVYDYDDENQVYLQGHYWEPCTTDRSMSLHIVSTSLGPEGAAHQSETEKALKKLIANYPGLDFLPGEVPPAWNATGDQNYPNVALLGFSAPAGQEYIFQAGKFAFSQAETEPISARSVRLGRLGRIKQQGRPLESLWQEPDPLGEAACNCGSLVV
jgi:hypothetical protein